MASFVDDILAAHPEFQTILFSSLSSRDDKLDMLDRVIGPYGSELFTNFLKVLARHERLNLLPLILSESQQLHIDRTGRKRVFVTSARPLSDASLGVIGRRLDDVFPFEPVIEVDTDPALLGGLIIRIDTTVYDSSLRTRLKQLRTRLRERSLHEIQSGRDRFSHSEGN